MYYRSIFAGASRVGYSRIIRWNPGEFFAESVGVPAEYQVNSLYFAGDLKIAIIAKM